MAVRTFRDVAQSLCETLGVLLHYLSHAFCAGFGKKEASATHLRGF